MIEVVSFKAEHLEAIKARECHASEMRSGIRPSQPIHTFLLNGQPLAIFGGVHVHKRFFSAWALISEDVTKIPVEFTKKTKRLLDAYMETYDLFRLDIQVRADYRVGQRFADFLGFRCEGKMERYGWDGCDYLMYARTKWLT